MLPGIYVGMISFHQELIPTSLAITIITARSHIPLPAFFECLVLLIAYETLREAGARMPRQLGQTLSIVGTLIIGEAAISAGLVSALMIVVVAFSGTAVFTIPCEEMYTALGVLRFIFLILGGLAGMIGIVYGLLMVEFYLVSRRSFGVPYMYPICPFNLSKTRDVLVRVPLWKLNEKNRPLR
jgi:spore germination protein KA